MGLPYSAKSEKRGLAMEIKHPEWLQLDIDNRNLYGYNQKWYTTSFQRTRGCGPTAAAMLLVYLNRREAGPLPYEGYSISDVTKVLEDVWDFVTPGWLTGLSSTEKFCRGVEALLLHYGLKWRCRRLGVTALRDTRASLAQVVKFIEEGIASDCPIAFLNLHKGQVTAIESWHWIVITALSHDASRGQYRVTCYDGGRAVTFDLGLWLETTRLGGGFVYMHPYPAGAAENKPQ